MATIKTELVRSQRFKTRDEARLAVFRYIVGFYNPHRRHSVLGYRSPAEYEKMLRDDEALLASAVLRKGVNENGVTPTPPPLHEGSDHSRQRPEMDLRRSGHPLHPPHVPPSLADCTTQFRSTLAPASQSSQLVFSTST